MIPIALLENIFTTPADLVIRYLNVADFDRVRVAATQIHHLSSSYERHVLRRTIDSLSVTGQVTHIELVDLLREERWSALISVAGWLDNGRIGRSLRTLRERLTGLREIWISTLPAAGSSGDPTRPAASRLRPRRGSRHGTPPAARRRLE